MPRLAMNATGFGRVGSGECGLTTHFVTGVTGFVGSHLTHRLLLEGERVVTMVRASDNEAARARLLPVLAAIGSDRELPLDNLLVFAGDVTQTTDELVAGLRAVTDEHIDMTWHSAVTFKFRKRDLPEIEAINIQGSRNMILTTLGLNGERERPRYMHVSTAYSSGRLQGTVPERVVESTPDYRGLYEWSKHKVELDMARIQKQEGLDVTVLRPAIIVGCEDTRSVNHSGYYQVIGTMYKIFLMRRQKLGSAWDHRVPLRFEANPAMRLNLVPIDYVIDSMVALAARPELCNRELKVFNLVNEDAPVMQDIVDVMEASLGISGLEMVDEAEFAKTRMSAIERVFSRAISFQAPYIKEDIRFETRRFRALVDKDEVPVPVLDAPAIKRLNYAYFDLIRPEIEASLSPAA